MPKWLQPKNSGNVLPMIPDAATKASRRDSLSSGILPARGCDPLGATCEFLDLAHGIQR